MSIAFLFPGQGSQKPGMGASLRRASPEAAEAFARVSRAVGRDVAALCEESDEETLRRTENAQPALFACGVAAAAALSARGVCVAFCAGHSVGEYAALAAAGVVSVEDGARLVALRGRLMSEARGGTMAAVLGLDDAEVERVCAETRGTVVVANYNCPGQVVVSGEPAAVEAAGRAAQEAGAKRVVPLNVSGAFHSPLMADAAERMRAALREVEFRRGDAGVASNVTGGTVSDPSEWPELLARQIAEPVRWTACVRALLAGGADRFYECGSGSVLCGLLKRIERPAECVVMEDAEGLRRQ